MSHELAKHDTGPTNLAVLDYGDAAGLGFDRQTADDVAIPFLNIIQPLSPELQGDASEKIPGAQAGMMFNSVTKELFSGETGVVFQLCDTKQEFVEWKPRDKGGGFVGVHGVDSEVVVAARAASTKFGKYTSKEGNDLVQTFNTVGLLHRTASLEEQIASGTPEAMVIAFTSTKIKSYRAIMTRLSNFMHGKVPLFAHRVKITTVREQRDKGISYNFRIEPLVGGDVAKSLIPPKHGDGPNPLLVTAQKLLKAYRGGALKTADKTQSRDSGGPGNATGDDGDAPF
jgi:hypothetical protein